MPSIRIHPVHGDRVVAPGTSQAMRWITERRVQQWVDGHPRLIAGIRAGLIRIKD